ncbi:uncharacterized protein LOC125178391 [Hyalella azteca]|uniref:Uncharacterized protein LOC125178391 n=1 Tax=Hyalella azteca TaxID=294128 RepID=A0A979FLS1_HYAAZ|nr:uncharacterized protein LOC125178391 [Hyalella azteca]
MYALGCYSYQPVRLRDAGPSPAVPEKVRSSKPRKSRQATVTSKSRVIKEEQKTPVLASNMLSDDIPLYGQTVKPETSSCTSDTSMNIDDSHFAASPECQHHSEFNPDIRFPSEASPPNGHFKMDECTRQLKDEDNCNEEHDVVSQNQDIKLKAVVTTKSILKTNSKYPLTDNKSWASSDSVSSFAVAIFVWLWDRCWNEILKTEYKTRIELEENKQTTCPESKNYLKASTEDELNDVGCSSGSKFEDIDHKLCLKTEVKKVTFAEPLVSSVHTYKYRQKQNKRDIEEKRCEPSAVQNTL